MNYTINSDARAREELCTNDRITVDYGMAPEPGYPVMAGTPGGRRFVGYYHPDESGDGFSVIPVRGVSGWKSHMPVFSQNGVRVLGVVTHVIRDLIPAESAKSESDPEAPYRSHRDGVEAAGRDSER